MKNLLSIVAVSVLALIGGYSSYQAFSGSGSDIKLEPINYAATPIQGLVKNETLLRPALKQMGISGLMAKLVKESNGGSTFDCHQEAHTIGRVGYEFYKEKAFGDCDASCHSGCYHGAMEKFLNEKGTANLSANIDGVCGTFKTVFGNFECLHGVGHGLLAYLDYDLPGTVDECKNLKDSFSIQSCYGGMFMENILTAQGLGASGKQVHETKWVNKTDPHFPCNALDNKNYDLRYQCYQMQTSWMLDLFKYDFSKVSAECLKAAPDMVAVCFKSYGRDAAGNSLRDVNKIKSICGQIPKASNYYEECIYGATNVIVDFWGPGLKDQATELCKVLDLRGKEACYYTLSWRLPQLFQSKDQIIEICTNFEKGYEKYCPSK